MKAKIFFLTIIFFLSISNCFTQTSTIINTPKGTEFTAWTNMPYMSEEEKAELSWDVIYTYPQASQIGSATRDYNCHGFAWHYSEGSSPVWIGLEYYDEDPEVVEDVYWTDESYIETTEQYASKISYYTGNHSAIQTSTQGIYISKWGYGPLVQHARDYGPSYYEMSNRKYYRLNPGIDGTVTPLCVNLERTFTSNTSISGSTYSWTKDNDLLDYVSGSGTTSYRVKANNNSGNGWLRLQITTPSGEVATTNYKNVWVGTPILNYVTGPESGYTYNTYTFYADPRRDPLSQAEYTWILNPLNGNSVRPYYDYADIAFYKYGAYQVVARAENTCGLSEWAVTEISISDNYGYSLSPNPASGNLTIIVTKLTTTESEATNPELTTYTVSIFNFYGILQSSVKKTGTNFTIPVGNLKDGNYFVQISNGKKTKSLPLIIKH